MKHKRKYFNQIQGDAQQGGAPQVPQVPQAAQAPSKLQSWLANLTGAKAPTEQATAQAPAGTPAQQATPQSAAEVFGQLFAKEPAQATPEKEPKVPTNPWDITPETLKNKFGTLDVGQYVDPAKVTAALAGDQGAFVELLSAAVQIGAMSSYQASVQASKDGVTHSTNELQAALPQKFKDFSITSALGQDAVLSAPHIQPIAKMVSDQILAAYPRATEADIKQGISLYLKDLGTQFATPTQAQEPQTSAKSIDWTEHFKSL